jgi:predicted Zn-dependent protease
MAMDLPTLRKLVSLDPNDPLSRFALGKKLFETGASPDELAEAADHLTFANGHAPDHLATYHILGQTLIKLGRTADARRVLEEGVKRTAGIGEGMGRDLGPAMETLLASLP